jgi:hypothetical protein
LEYLKWYTYADKESVELEAAAIEVFENCKADDDLNEFRGQ